MSGVSTASAAGSAGLAALLGGAPEGSGFGGSAATAPSSFGAALALAERMLDSGADITVPADAADVAPGEATAPPGHPDVQGSTDAAGGGNAAPDAALSAAIPVLAALPIAPVAESSPHPAAGEDAIAEDAIAEDGAAEDAIAGDARAVSGRQPTQAADMSRMTDADTSAIPVALASAAIAAGDQQPVVAAPAVGATSGSALDAPVARAVPVPLPSPTALASDALPVIPAATPLQKGESARPDQAAQPTPVTSASASAPAVSVSPTGPPVATTLVTAPDAAAAAPRAVAAQVAPVVLSIVQRPVGSHQLTMTVNPDTLGPVTVRAHISAGGEVRVELLGATDAGRDALRTIVTDLRRDLAAVMPHASLTLGSSAAATDAGNSDRGAQPGGGGASGEQAPGERGRAAADGRPSAESRAGGIPSILPITTRAVAGEGLDIFA